MLNCDISYSFGRQTALNDNGVRPSAHHRSKGFGEPPIGPWYRDGLNLNPCKTASKLDMIESQLCK